MAVVTRRKRGRRIVHVCVYHASEFYVLTYMIFCGISDTYVPLINEYQQFAYEEAPQLKWKFCCILLHGEWNELGQSPESKH